ncbi:MAG: hypothetical protein ACOC7J_07685, partial [Armatimonadota bacterium]
MRLSGISVLLGVVAIACTSPLAGAAEDLMLDDFEYPSEEAAREAWTTDEGSESVGLFEYDDGAALRINADFTSEDSRRAVYDRDVELDLSRWG